MGSKRQDFPDMVLKRGESSRVDVGENSLSLVEYRDSSLRYEMTVEGKLLRMACTLSLKKSTNNSV